LEYRTLGPSGLKSSLAGLGTTTFGSKCDAMESARIVHRALELGVNFFDTANNYGHGLSEEYLGRALRGRRRDAIIATKFGNASTMQQRGASRRAVIDAAEASLRRLHVDYIDLYQVHYWDPVTPIEETFRALDDLVHRGCVRYIGCSNFTGSQIVEAQRTAVAECLTQLASVQDAYHLLDRNIEPEILPVLGRLGLGLVCYGPLAGGFLTGKYRRGAPPPPGSRFAGGRDPFAGAALHADHFVQLERLDAFAHALGRTIGELALGWLASQQAVTTVIAAVTSCEQLEENVRGVGWRLTVEELRALDDAVGYVRGAPPLPGPWWSAREVSDRHPRDLQFRV